jgi:hypothetical protein
MEAKKVASKVGNKMGVSKGMASKASKVVRMSKEAARLDRAARVARISLAN